MSNTPLPLIIFFIIISSPCLSQTKSISATKLEKSAITDTRPGDPVWNNISPVGEFITSTPVFGKKASRETEVKIAYDNTAVYILAYLHDDPKKIKRQLTARDDIDGKDVDVFSVGIDTYDDKQNAFSFKVSAAGVQEDAKLSTIEDASWDAVWESKVYMKSDGWIAEIKIPFSAIRFSKKNIQFFKSF